MCQAITKSGTQCRRRGEPFCSQHAASRAGPNRGALEAAVGALATGPHHAALIQSCRGLADVLDQADGFDDKLWREYRLALKALMEATSSDDDGLSSLVDDMRAEMGDAAVT